MAVYKEERTNTWRVIYRYTDWNGERKQSQKRGFPTKREAQAWEREQLNQKAGDPDMTFASFVELYKADIRHQVNENTMQTKEHIIRTKLIPYFGKRRLSEITSKDVLKWQNEMIDHRDEKGKPYSPVYLRSLNAQLNAILNHAVNLHFSIASVKLNEGLDEQLADFIEQHPDTKLIIIDTLQRVRNLSREQYSYSSDYDAIAGLKRFTDRTGICLLLVHHTRKQSADDCFDMISGTNGLLGAVDGAFLLQKVKRTGNEATLEVSGRDQQDQKLYLTRDPEQLVWTLDHAETELWREKPDPILEAVVKMLSTDNPEWTGSPTELANRLGMDLKANVLTTKLNIHAGKLLNEYGIRYENRRTHS